MKLYQLLTLSFVLSFSSYAQNPDLNATAAFIEQHFAKISGKYYIDRKALFDDDEDARQTSIKFGSTVVKVMNDRLYAFTPFVEGSQERFISGSGIVSTFQYFLDIKIADLKDLTSEVSLLPNAFEMTCSQPKCVESRTQNIGIGALERSEQYSDGKVTLYSVMPFQVADVSFGLRMRTDVWPFDTTLVDFLAMIESGDSSKFSTKLDLYSLPVSGHFDQIRLATVPRDNQKQKVLAALENLVKSKEKQLPASKKIASTIEPSNKSPQGRYSHLKVEYEQIRETQDELTKKGYKLPKFDMTFEEYASRVERLCRSLDNQRLFKDRPSNYPDSFISLEINSNIPSHYLTDPQTGKSAGLLLGKGVYKHKNPRDNFEASGYLVLNWRADLGKLAISFPSVPSFMIYENDFVDWQTSHTVEGNLNATRSCGLIDNFTGKSMTIDEAYNLYIK